MNLHIVFGKKDADIVCWIKGLPPQMFSHYARRILLAEKNRRLAVVPIPEKNELIFEKIDTKLLLSEKELTQYVHSFPQGKMSAEVKRILRKHIEWNYSRAQRNEATVGEIKAKHKSEPVLESDDEMSDEYRKMLMELSGKK